MTRTADLFVSLRVSSWIVLSSGAVGSIEHNSICVLQPACGAGGSLSGSLVYSHHSMVRALHANAFLHEPFNVQRHAFSFSLPNKFAVDLENA
jgi:hypothetical protein